MFESFISIFTLTISAYFVISAETGLLVDFQKFLRTFNKSYNYGSAEFWERFEIYKENIHRLEKLKINGEKDNISWYGVTKFFDLSHAEFKAKYLSDVSTKAIVSSSKNHTILFADFKKLVNGIPKRVDWRNRNGRNYVSPIKNQKSCGGCWAFSTTEAVESMYAIQKNTTPPHLSVQEVIDCSAGNLGCAGGDTCTALEWMVESQVPLVSDKEYPLTDTSDYCKLLPPSEGGVRVFNFTCSGYAGNEHMMLWLLHTQGPLTVAVDALSWSHYMGGIIQYHCPSTKVNHAVTIVGYDISGEVPYYIVRNSWGADFGLDGYLHIKVGGNLCGIAGRVSSVTVLPQTMFNTRKNES